MQGNNAKYIVRYLMYTLFACIFVVLASLFFKLTKGQTIINRVDYAETSSIDYRVYLKENKFFDNKYLTKEEIDKDSKLLVAELIDKINISYNYVLSFSDKMNGEFSYFVKAIIESNESAGSKNYWSKEYNLTDKKTNKINNAKNVVVLDEVSVSYDKYNKILNDWKNVANISMDGKLKVFLVFESKVECEKLKKKYQINSSDLKLELPLSKAATEIKIDDNTTSSTKKIEEKEQKSDSIYIKYRVLFVFSIVLAIISVILIIANRKNQVKDNKYYVELKKILNTYDGIIVNVSSLPDLDKFNVIKVRSFDELLDAHSEVRMPINYYSQKNKATFILVNDTMLWMYVLRNTRE